MLQEFDHQHAAETRGNHTAARGAGGKSLVDELMERIQARDEEALECFIRCYRSMLRYAVCRIIPNEQDANEVLEDVFLGVWNHAANFDGSKGTAIGWILTMARRRAIDRIRRRTTAERAELRLQASTETARSQFAEDDVGEDAAKSDTAALFQKLLSALPAAQSAVVRLAFYRGLSQREIARTTGLPLGTVKTRLELGVKKLRVAVSEIGPWEEWLTGSA